VGKQKKHILPSLPKVRPTQMNSPSPMPLRIQHRAKTDRPDDIENNNAMLEKEPIDTFI
jgi:hypothetical protein